MLVVWNWIDLGSERLNDVLKSYKNVVFPLLYLVRSSMLFVLISLLSLIDRIS